MLREEIISPCCGAAMEEDSGKIACSACGRVFDADKGYVDLLLDQESPKLIQWLWENRAVIKIYGAMRSAMMFSLAGRVVDEESEGFLLKHLLQIKGDENILDLSCGNGRHAIKVAERLDSGHLFGVDISEAMLDDLIRKLDAGDKSAARKITVIKGSSSVIPLKNGSMDKIYCVAAMHLYKDQQKVISESGRVLKSGGIFTGTIFMKSGTAPLRFLEDATYPLTGLVFNPRESFSSTLAGAGFETPDFAFLPPIAFFFTRKR
ncbi:MAG: class I SAM-dependent methyltransferase [Deltaproteobacteria bacterium]|nr:class I SAM-dependent methyltransferase [Deltaproteobacteria bacterium]